MAPPLFLTADKTKFSIIIIMQTSQIELSLGGETLNTVVKTVSVPEALVIMAAHGQHSIKFIPGTIEESRGIPHPQVLAQLTAFYGAEPVEQVFGKAAFGIRLPTRFSEVNLNGRETDTEEEEEDEETPAEKKKRIKAEKAHAALLAGAKEAPAPDAPADSGLVSETIGTAGIDPE